MNKKLAIAGGVAAVCTAGMIGVTSVRAANQPGQTLADKIAATFHLNSADVQKVIDQNRQDHQAEREQNYQQRLDKAASDGKITADQKARILAKHQEVMQFMASQKDKSPQDRKAAMDKERTDLQRWAKDNNIPIQYIAPLGGRGRGMGMHRGMHGMNNNGSAQ